MTRRSARSLLCLSAAVWLSACSSGQDDAPKLALRSVSVATVEPVSFEDRIEATGELQAKEKAVIAAEVEGRITEILLEEGSAADEGAALLTIDPERRTLSVAGSRAALEEARAARRKAERDWKRIAKLRDDRVASLEAMDEVETQLKLARSRESGAEARLGVAERALRDATVTAPFSGLVARRYVSRGEYVNVGQKLVDLVSLDPIEVEFRLAERDSGRVALGQFLDVRVAPYPDEVFRAEVSIIAPTIDAVTRTLRVKAKLDNSLGRLRPGLFARVDLGVAMRENVLIVPEESVLRRAGGAVVFRLQPSRHVQRVDVELGAIRSGVIEVVSGLSAGDRIVARGQSRLVDGELVDPRTAEGVALDEPSTVGRESENDA